jgi:hypothetical protein
MWTAFWILVSIGTVSLISVLSLGLYFRRRLRQGEPEKAIS